ncbi:MAG: Gfo/Idh/MocA family oxidoreductase [Armatimonadota bacterium]|nr:Gfo/Idh/MocA family oxidoreductase [Armatimonadota bacterium]
MKPVKVGVVGCGNISGIYFKAGQVFEILDIVACADLIMDRAKAKAEEFGCRAVTVDELMKDPEIEIVLNLTIPAAHAEIALKAIEAGKSVHNEKPLAISREEGKKILEAAKAKGVRVGCAPDTFMGAGIQTCIKLIDDGWIGEPIAATAFMLCHGHESWHPDPEFYYKPGGGPVFDMGPYYITALVAMMGPAKRVASSARITFPERTITSQPKYGTKIKVDVPTHVAGVVDFANGAIATIIQSFDVWGHNLPRIEVYGTEGSMSVPDPNGFGGPVRIKRPNGEWTEMPLSHIYHENSRGIGVADMAYGLRTGRKHRTNGELAFHVLDIMCALHESSDQGKHITLESTCERPKPLPMGLRYGLLDE